MRAFQGIIDPWRRKHRRGRIGCSRRPEARGHCFLPPRPPLYTCQIDHRAGTTMHARTITNTSASMWPATNLLHQRCRLGPYTLTSTPYFWPKSPIRVSYEPPPDVRRDRPVCGGAVFYCAGADFTADPRRLVTRRQAGRTCTKEAQRLWRYRNGRRRVHGAASAPFPASQ